MKKRLSRKIKKSIILIVVVIVVFLAIWILSQMAGILKWIMKNWAPFLVGFIIATIGNAVIELLIDDEEDEK